MIGHSFGSLISTFALRFWPDLGRRVDDFIGLSGVYTNGTAVAPTLCAVACPVAARQISPGSNFLRAYATRPLLRGPSYTTVATQFDELVNPQPRAGLLDGATNIMIQDVCPGRIVDHVSVVVDRLPYLIVKDAMSHPGPASVARLQSPCSGAFIPGSDPGALLPEAVEFVLGLGEFVEQRDLPEPPLRCYLRPRC